MRERFGVAGSGAIACGLAASAAAHGDVVLWARSALSAERARETLERIRGRMVHGSEAGVVAVSTDLDALADRTIVVESIVEDHDAKAALLAGLHDRLGADALLATTTSSLSVERLAAASGRPDRFVALHVFNPVVKMELVELAFPGAAGEDTRTRSRELCAALGKTAVEVPDVPGFVVNRLLFPFLFSAVELMEETGIGAEEVDRCMRLGANHPLGPLALLDFVGLDVALAIGETIGASVPRRLRALVDAGALGRKAGRGFHQYG